MTCMADLRRHVDRRHVDRPGHVGTVAIRRSALDHGLVRVDRDRRRSPAPERADGLVAELAAIGRRADDGDACAACARNASVTNIQSCHRAPGDSPAPAALQRHLSRGPWAAGDRRFRRSVLRRGGARDGRARRLADAALQLRAAFQKPILFYWLVAATYTVAGVGETQARLWAALSGVGLVLCRARVPADAGSTNATALHRRRDRRDRFGYFSHRAAGAARPAARVLHHADDLRGARRHRRRRCGPARRWLALAGAAAGCAFLTKGRSACSFRRSCWSRSGGSNAGGSRLAPAARAG